MRKEFKMLHIVFIILYLNHVLAEIAEPTSKIDVWGPGLTPDKIVMKARYFFVSIIEHGNASTDFSNEQIHVVLDGTNKKKQPCRIWTEILNRKDGIYIVRYKVHEICSYLKINVIYQDKHLAESPYIINNEILSDDCMCPEKAETFLQSWKCGATPSLIKSKLEVFGSINWDKTRKMVIEAFDKPLSISICHYVIKSNQVYRKCYGKYVGFKMFMDKILLFLTRRVMLPDLEFFTNLGDWPLSTKDLPDKYPVLSWCGSSESYDIVMPTYEITESILENMGRVSVNSLSVQGNVEGLWETRIPKLFWRGRDSNKHRLDLVLLSKKYPDLFNVSITNFFFYKDEEHIYGPKTEHSSFYKFFDYKYQLAIDGTVSPYRMPFLLAGGSLVFKPDSKYFEHFYSDMKPNTHYVPVKQDLSDLVEKIRWAIENDSQAKKIAKSGQEFANDNISPTKVLCYYMQLFNELSQKITSSVQVLDDMELVDQEKLQSCDCFNIEKNTKNEL